MVAHVIEHMPPDEGEAVMRSYLPYLRPGGKVLFICPQERGYASDPTHVRWTTGEDLEELSRSLGLEPQPWRSFPFPRWAGKPFTYNEFNVVAIKPASIDTAIISRLPGLSSPATSAAMSADTPSRKNTGIAYM